jgi:hypothetical protein
MKSRLPSATVVLLAVALCQTAVARQSASKIIDSNKKASGGSALKRVKSLMMRGVVRGPDGSEGRFELRALGPDKLRIDIQSGTLQLSECYNGKSAWRLDSRGLRTVLGAEAKRLRLEALITNSRLRDLSRYRVAPLSVSRDATASGGSKPANVVELAMNEARVRLYFDQATNLMVKQESGPSNGRQIVYDDYRRVDGVMEPISLTIANSAGQFFVAIDRVEHNAAINPEDFLYPQTEGGAPLPEIGALMTAIVENQEKIEELREHYTFRETETENKLDGDGRVKESETRVYEVTPVAGTFVRRLIAVNGKELSASEQQKRDREVQKDVEEAIKSKDKRLKERRRAAEKGDDDDSEDDDRVTILRFLKLSEITSMRREMFRGHEVIAFDFEPKKGVEPRTRIDKLITKLAGTMWVDEQARQIARLEARLLESFKFGGGLVASVSPSTAFALEQEKVGGEVWLPSYAEASISARLFLLAKFNRSVQTRYDGYKKYQIDTSYELDKPKEAKRPEHR